MEPIKADQ